MHDAIIDKHVKCPLLKINTNKYYVLLIGLCRSLIQSFGYFSVTPLAAENTSSVNVTQARIRITHHPATSLYCSRIASTILHDVLTRENSSYRPFFHQHFTSSTSFQRTLNIYLITIHFPAVPRTITPIGERSRMIACNYCLSLGAR